MERLIDSMVWGCGQRRATERSASANRRSGSATEAPAACPWIRDGPGARPPGLHVRKGKMVGATGFEPATTCPPCKCATRLRYAPTGDWGDRLSTGMLSREREIVKPLEERKARYFQRRAATKAVLPPKPCCYRSPAATSTPCRQSPAPTYSSDCGGSLRRQR